MSHVGTLVLDLFQKDLLYQKAAKRVEDIRPEIGNSMFDEIEDEIEVDTEPQEEE